MQVSHTCKIPSEGYQPGQIAVAVDADIVFSVVRVTDDVNVVTVEDVAVVDASVEDVEGTIPAVDAVDAAVAVIVVVGGQ